MSAILQHYVLDSASPDWLREMSAMEDEANAEELWPAWRMEELARKHGPDPEEQYGDELDCCADDAGIPRFGEI